ncbi:MAG: TIGR04219 family outer membrane beta-barrel protein [Psychrosphaera sp.]|nr:TIGR04219 family outer membrane beta-barrel protein [Psychrosphaera sp.]
MKKITTTAIALAACLTATNVCADTLLGVYAGVQTWNMDSEGSFGQVKNGVSSSAAFAFEKETQNSYYVALEHPIPLVPNVKIKHNEMETNGDTTLTGTFVFGDDAFSVSSELATTVDLTNTDFILYYEILDNDLVTIDIGLNAKKVEGVLTVVDKNDATHNATETFTGYVPMLYGNFEIGLPFTGLGIFAEGSLLSVGDHTLYDYEAGIGYTFIDNLAIDMTIRLGYRAVKLELQDLDDVDTNLEFDGVFIGLEAHF